MMALETLCQPAFYLAGNKCCKINKVIKLKTGLPPATVRSYVGLQPTSSFLDLWKEAHVSLAPTWHGPLITWLGIHRFCIHNFGK